MTYVGSGPYCYANSLAMVLGNQTPEPSAIEVLTGSPFGVMLLEGDLPFFSPGGWDPSIGLDAAIGLLGWDCECAAGGDVTEALHRLRGALRQGPVIVGPLEMGLLLHRPGSGAAIGADHYVIVLEVDENTVRFHDPDGFPHATLPAAQFAKAWQAESIGYAGAPYEMRSNFSRQRDIILEAALRASIPKAIDWLTQESEGTSLAGEPALAALADRVEAGLTDTQHGHLVHFAIRVGTRRLSDAARWLETVGLTTASEIADRQARILGRVQYDLVANNRGLAASTLRLLAPTYGEMRDALARAFTY